MNLTEKAKTVVQKIVDDIQDRQGLGNEWEMIDQMFRQELKDEWRKIVIQEFEKS